MSSAGKRAGPPSAPVAGTAAGRGQPPAGHSTAPPRSAVDTDAGASAAGAAARRRPRPRRPSDRRAGDHRHRHLRPCALGRATGASAAAGARPRSARRLRPTTCPSRRCRHQRCHRRLPPSPSRRRVRLPRGPTRPATPTPGPAAPPPRRGGADEISKLKLTVHVWADKPAERLVFINGRKYVQGDRIEDKVLLEEITQEGAMVSYQGRRSLLRP